MEIPYIKLKFASDKPTPPLSDKPSKYCISDNMSLFLLLLLLLCLSLHACGARPFGVVDIERIVTGLQLPHKVSISFLLTWTLFMHLTHILAFTVFKESFFFLHRILSLRELKV